MRRSSFMRLMNLKAPFLANAWTDAARAASSGSNWAAAHKKRHEDALFRHAASLGLGDGAVPLDGDPGFDDAYAAAWDDYNDCGNVRDMDPKNALLIALDLARRANSGDTDFTAPDRSFYGQYIAAHPEFAASDSGGAGQSGGDSGLSGSVLVSALTRNSRGGVSVGFTDNTVSPPVIGHMCPAGDMTSDAGALLDTFNTANACPQLPALNRGDWKALETALRNEAAVKPVICVCGPVWTNGCSKLIGGGGVAVPDLFFKIAYGGTCTVARAWVFPNKDGNRPLGEYSVPLTAVETQTGLTFSRSSIP